MSYDHFINPDLIIGLLMVVFVAYEAVTKIYPSMRLLIDEFKKKNNWKFLLKEAGKLLLTKSYLVIPVMYYSVKTHSASNYSEIVMASAAIVI